MTITMGDHASSQNGDEQAPFVFILGMHRSGTSCLAGCLELCGLYLGDVLRQGRHNAKGYFESQTVIALHNQILALNKASWHTPLTPGTIHPYHRESIQKIVDQLEEDRPCGLKDPRLLFLLDGWLDVVAPPHALVGTFRHPLAVAQSLAHRNGMSLEAACDLWVVYNQRLVELHQKRPFPLVEYRMDSLQRYCTSVAEVARTLGLRPDMRELEKFVSPNLEHHTFDSHNIPVQCQYLYKYLLENQHKPSLHTLANFKKRRQINFFDVIRGWYYRGTSF